MKINYENISTHIGDFVKWYCVFFTGTAVGQYLEAGNKIGVSNFIFPVFGALCFALFFTEKAPWRIYKKGDKVWWSTYGKEPAPRQKVLSFFGLIGFGIVLWLLRR